MTGFVARAEAGFNAAQRRVVAEPDSVEAGWQYTRACFDLASVTTNTAERARIAELGIAAGRQWLARTSTVAAVHYYLGMNIGVLADTKRNLAALRMVNEMESSFQLAAKLEPSFDHAGPDRNLGLLYLEAPSVISVGNRNKARLHLRRAAELAPNYPENRLNLIEAYLKWSERGEAAREFRSLQQIWPDAKSKFTGDDWTMSWVDWERRLADARKKLIEPTRPIESPRGTP